MRIKEFDIVEIGVEESHISYFPMWCYKGGTLSLFNVVQVKNIISRVYMGHLPMKTKLNVNIGCVKSLWWSHVSFNVAELTFHYRIPII